MGKAQNVTAVTMIMTTFMIPCKPTNLFAPLFLYKIWRQNEILSKGKSLVLFELISYDKQMDSQKLPHPGI